MHEENAILASRWAHDPNFKQLNEWNEKLKVKVVNFIRDMKWTYFISFSESSLACTYNDLSFNKELSPGFSTTSGAASAYKESQSSKRHCVH